MPFRECEPACGLVHTDHCRLVRLGHAYAEIQARATQAEDTVAKLQRQIDKLTAEPEPKEAC